MRRVVGGVLLVVAIGVGAGSGLTQPPAGDPEIEAELAGLAEYGRQVLAGREAASRLLGDVAARAPDPEVARQLRTALAEGGLYAGQLAAIDDWAGALRNHGFVDDGFAADVRSAMQSWRARHGELLKALAEAETILRERPVAAPPGCRGSEAPDCLRAARDAEAARRDATSATQTAVDLLRRPGPRVAFDGPAPPAPACGDQTPAGMRFEAGRMSAIVNETIQLSVRSVGRDDRAAAVRVTTEVEIEVEGAESDVKRVTIPKGRCAAPLKVVPKRPGPARAKARAPGLKPADIQVDGCLTGPVDRMGLTLVSGDVVPADGWTPGQFKLKFFDRNGQTTTGREPKELRFDYEGLNAPAGAGSDRVARDECTSQRSITSSDVARVTVTVRYRAQEPEVARFRFRYELTPLVAALVGAGALLGFAVRLRERRPARRLVRLGDSLLAGAIAAGVALGVLLLCMPLPSPSLYWTIAVVVAAALGSALGVLRVWRAIERRLSARRDGA